MAITSGTKLGPYEVAGAIGAGGMGEVDRARDPRLNRAELRSRTYTGKGNVQRRVSGGTVASAGGARFQIASNRRHPRLSRVVESAIKPQ